MALDERNLYLAVAAFADAAKDRVNKGLSTQDEASADWACSVAEMATVYGFTNTVAEDNNLLLWRDRRQRNASLFHEVAVVKTVRHPSVPVWRLVRAVQGDPRVPLCFENEGKLQSFCREVYEALKRGGITDAVVQLIGSSTTGWRGNPLKHPAPWEPRSDVDLALFSTEALWQALEIGTPPNTRLIAKGRFPILKNLVASENGFLATKVGRELHSVADDWRLKLCGGKCDAIDFKLNLATSPLASAFRLPLPSTAAP